MTLAAAYLLAIALLAKASGIPEPIPKIIGSLAALCLISGL